MFSRLVIAALASGCLQDLELDDRRFPCASRFDCLDTHRCDPTGICVPSDAPPHDAGVEPKPIILDVAAGGRHTCVLIEGGEVRCFGDNQHGQLGLGTVDGGSVRPTRVPGLGVVKAIAAGHYHTCVIEEPSHVRCWGSNEFGQIGQPFSSAVPSPSEPIVTDAAELAIGQWQSSCVRTLGDELKCWGFTLDGQAWGDPNPRGSASPLAIPIGRPIASASVGGYHACVVSRDGATLCFGHNSSGQVGIGTTESTASPTPIALEPDMLSLGDLHGCALVDGSVRCWGHGPPIDGILHAVSTPTEVPLDGEVAEVQAGHLHTCARFTNGVLRCWGSTEYGAAGAGTGHREPGPIDGIDRATRLFRGWDHMCAMIEGGDVLCWGYNVQGGLGRLPLGPYNPVAEPIEF